MERLISAALLLLGIVLAGSALAQTPAAKGYPVATFGSGCFWCTESDFDKVEGVIETVSGYMGGTTKNPTYAQVSSGATGHAEVVQVRYDPAKVSYERLLEVYWHNVDPFNGGGQFCDRGSQYRPVIFAHSPEQKATAEASKERVAKELGRSIAVQIQDAGPFTPAESYHQNFHNTNPTRYQIYRIGCGRDARLRQIWGDKAGK
ncbi:MAG: peptide-methionine (S)-S-oxide reductase MsrA [Hyphomicrobiaceae bacterium]